MTPSVAILDADEIDRLPPPATEPQARARRWTAALVRAGPRHYVDNADVTARAVVVDDKVLPLLLANGRRGNADVCSFSSHYIAYTLEEFLKRHSRLPAILPSALMLPLRAILAIGRTDHVAFVNNWLFATNPRHGLSSVEIAAVTAHVAAAHPDASIVFRSNNPRVDAEGVGRLRENGYRLIRSRRVYLLDASNTRYLRHENARVDLRLLERTGYRIVEDSEVLLPHAARLAALYRGLYLDKHSRLNPQLNERFFVRTLEERILTYRALEWDGRIDAFAAFYLENDVVTSAIIGYDRGTPTEVGLYRMLIALLMAEGAERRTLVNLSAGADRFKLLRGAVPVEEYDAVYDRHLPSARRYAWVSLRVATDIWTRARREPMRPAPDAAPAGVDWDRA
jgi:hypothetical protein